MPNKTAKDAPDTLPAKAKEIWAAAFNASWADTCKSRSDRDACAAKIAWSAVKNKYVQSGDKWAPKAMLVDVSLTITKASLHDDGTMRWQAVASDTNADRLGEQTTLALFQDWIERAESGKSVDFLPPPRKPFLGVSHYPDLDGFGEAGLTEQMYIDRNRFKAAGTFYADPAHPLGKALFEAVRQERELIQRGGQVEQPIRISAAWWDIAHSHGDFVFERKSLDHICPMCAKGAPRTFLQGQLDHYASTRVPINPRTSLALEEKSMATKRDDAASIVGDELAEELDKKTRTTVGKSETELPEGLVVKGDDEETPADETADLVEQMGLGGATSMADAEAFIEAEKLANQVWSNFDMFMVVLDNIMYAHDEELNKMAAISAAVKEFGNRVAALKAAVSDAFLLQPVIDEGEFIMSEETTTTTATDPVETLKALVGEALANTKLDRNGKAQVIQQAFEEYAGAVKAQLDAVAPPDATALMQQAFAPIAEKLDLIITKLGQQATQAAPVQKSFAPGQPVLNTGQQQPPTLRSMIRKSVGIVE